MLSIFSSTVGFNAPSMSTVAHRAPSATMKAVPALETKFIYETKPESLGKTMGFVQSLQDVTGAMVSTSFEVGKTVPALETKFIYETSPQSLGKTMGLVLGATPAVAANTDAEEQEPTRSTGKAVPSLEAAFIYESSGAGADSLGKTMGLVLQPGGMSKVSSSRKAGKVEAMEGDFVYGESGRWSGA